ncbi:hypothetical protein [Streptomyces sp. NBRC 14336]|uniref:hypothetical protein n=1 Tax=Streptomyces sp. NBRC 14336 TaxID=3030992 RepID=UPI0025573215|nr:hypothetical protein [Streptomyces sp. NBRC 14336]
MPHTPADQPKRTKRGDGFPHDTAWNQAHDRFRAALARLARDPDPAAQAAADRLAQRGVQVLTALTTEAEQAQETADHERALVERRHRTLVRTVNRLGHTGQPLPPNLAALVNPPQEPQ